MKGIDEIIRERDEKRMEKKEILQKMNEVGIIPVVVLEKEEDALPLGKALSEGGLPCAEVTFRTAAAKGAIAILRKEYPNMLVGAGTVLTKKQVDEAIEAGAQFIVSPGLNPEVVTYCMEKEVLIVPGISEPSGVEAAMSLGLDTVKFFPAEAAGGINMIRSMAAPYGGIKFMPTGGINLDNMKEYLSFDKVIACGGSFMVPSDLIRKGDFAEIQRRTQETVERLLDFRLKRVGIPEQGKENPLASVLSDMGMMEEESKNHYIEISTRDLKRALSYMKEKGVGFQQSGEDTSYYAQVGDCMVKLVQA